MFIRSFFKLFAGTAAVQAVTIFFYPILGRIYSPSDFGVFGFVTSASLILSIFTSGQLHMAFAQHFHSTNADQELGELSVLFSTITNLCAFPILACVQFFMKFNFEWTWIIPLFSFSLCLNEISKMWMVHLRKYGTSSTFTASNRTSSNLLKTFFPNKLGLIYSEILVNITLSSLFFYSKKINPFRNGLKKLSSFSHYPTFYTFGAFSQALQQELPVFVFRMLFTSAQIGFYVMANRFTVQSILLITSSVVLLLANQSQDKMNSKQLRLELLRITSVGFPLILVAGSVLYFFGSSIFEFFLGKNWGEVGRISSYLVILTLPKMMFTPLYARFLRFGEVKKISFLRVTQIAGAIGLFYLVKELKFDSLLLTYVCYDFITDILIVIVSYKFLQRLMNERNDLVVKTV